MNYRVFILPSEQKELERLPEGEHERVRDLMLALAQDPRPPGCTKLRNREGWRVR
jgi:mRNA interferase RelE/StbE